MKSKHFVTLFFMVGLVFAITGLVGPAMARDQINNNREADLDQDSEVILDTFTTDQPAEAGSLAPPPPGPIEPPGPPAGGSFFNGTVFSSPLVIPAAGFSGDGFDPGTFFFSFSGGYVSGNSGNYGCVKAPAYLPNGATITSMYATLYDNDASDSAWVDLYRVNKDTGVTDFMGTVETTGASTDIQNLSDSSISDPVVSYPTYAYYLGACLNSSSLRLYIVRIHYVSP